MSYSDFLADIWKNKVNFTDLINQANVFESKNENHFSAMLYLAWLSSHDGDLNAVAYYNLGVIYFKERKYAKAAECYRSSIAINPKIMQSYVNLGLALENIGKWEEACQEWLKVEGLVNVDDEEQKEILISSFNNIGRLYENLKKYDESLSFYEKSLKLKGCQKEVLHHAIFSRARQCLWPVYEVGGDADIEFVKNSTSALAMIAISDDAEKQKELAVSYAESKAPLEKNLLSKKERYPHKKIRIGYCSSDFSLHPVSMLMVELIELHDRDKFEVYGFCWSPEDGSDLRHRIIKSFDHYIRIKDLTDEEAAKKIRDCEIDVLIDLQGQTAGARMKMLSWRPAPIQITYLGLPATTGLPSIDYVIADNYLVPPGYEKFYSEKIIYMPDVYQPSDTKRIHNPSLTRAEYGLPEKGFVFCSFNNNHKYTLEVFTVWMNILKKVEGSVLWLLADNPSAERNLKKQAVQQGVDEERIIFSKRAAPVDYLAKYLVADLFLDTFPFNAGTTANDALWMELPILTVSGKTFASRMAGALLTAANIPELIARDFFDYEKKAINFATKKSHLGIKKKIKAAKNGGVLFDMKKFSKNYEEKISELWNSLPLNEELPMGLLDVVAAAEDLKRNQDFNSCENLYKKWIEDNALDPMVWVAKYNLAVLLFELNNFTESKKYFLEVLQERNDPSIANLLNRPEFLRKNGEKKSLSFSVIVTTHLRPVLLKRALQSIRNQLLPEGAFLEVIVVSDCEDSETDAVCNELLSSSDTYRVRNGVAGPALSRNIGIDIAQGEYILFLDDDDAWEKKFISQLFESDFIFSNGDMPFYTDCVVVNELRNKESYEIIGEKVIKFNNSLTEDIYVKNQISLPCYVIPAKIAKSIKFDIEMKAYEDWEYFVKLFSKQKAQHLPIIGPRIHEVHQGESDRRGNSEDAKGVQAIREYLYVYMRHPAHTDEIKRKRSEFMKAIGIDLPWAIM